MIKFKKSLCTFALLFFLTPPASASSSALFGDSSAIVVSDEDRKLMVEIARAVKRVKRNPFTREAEQRESTDSDLREKEDGTNAENETEEEESSKSKSSSSSSSSSSSRPDVFTGSSSDYCNKFEQHFSFYCVGEVDRSGKNEYVLSKFCPSYKKACSHKTITSSTSLTSWPTDPFDKEIVVTSRPVLATSARKKSNHRGYSDEDDSADFDSKEDEEIYYAELRKRYPCKPDCDHRIFAHCTQECKCDYIYPIVQRFCNPPPLPLFLNTCRLWYHGCPKYERYHYSSQFVYSKAEKGKVLPGTPEGVAGNPYNLPAPAPLRTNRALALAPIRHRYSRQKRAAADDEEEILEMIIPPPVPRPSKLADLKSVSLAEKKDEEVNESAEKRTKVKKFHFSEENEDGNLREVPMSAPQSRAILLNYQNSMEKKQRSRRKKSRRRRHHHRPRYHYDEEYEKEPVRISTTPKPLTPVELWRALKKINSITSGPGAVGLTQSPASLRGGGGGQQGGLDGFLESLSQEQQAKQEAQQGGTVKQWAGLDAGQFTKELVNAATGQNAQKEVSSETVEKTEKKAEPSEEPDFSKIKPRTVSSDQTAEIPNTKTSQKTSSSGKAKAFQGSIPVLPSDASIGAGTGDDTFRAFDGLSDSRGLVHTPRSRSPFTKPGLWEPNPADPHSRDPANKYWYHPESVGVDWLNGQLQWGGHWAVPAAGTGGTAGMSAVHFPTIGSFLNIPDDYD